MPVKPKFETPRVTAEEAMQDWRQAVCTAQPLANADFVRAVCQNILHLAHRLAMENNLKFPKVAAFLLMASRQWCLGGFPVTKVLDRIPTDLHGLGLLKIEVGGDKAVSEYMSKTGRSH